MKSLNIAIAAGISGIFAQASSSGFNPVDYQLFKSAAMTTATKRNGGRASGAAALKRAATKRRNIRARGKK